MPGEKGGERIPQSSGLKRGRKGLPHASFNGLSGGRKGERILNQQQLIIKKGKERKEAVSTPLFLFPARQSRRGRKRGKRKWGRGHPRRWAAGKGPGHRVLFSYFITHRLRRRKTSTMFHQKKKKGDLFPRASPNIERKEERGGLGTQVCDRPKGNTFSSISLISWKRGKKGKEEEKSARAG